jgi:hypothetical protein
MKKVFSLIVMISILTITSIVLAQDIRAGHSCPCVVKKIHGTIMMVDRNNKPIKTYAQVNNRANRQLYQTQDRIWVLRGNKRVFVYDIQTGNQIRSYYAPNLNNWVK